MTTMLFYSNSFHKYPLVLKAPLLRLVIRERLVLGIGGRCLTGFVGEGMDFFPQISSGEERKNGGMGKKSRTSTVEYSKMCF